MKAIDFYKTLVASLDYCVNEDGSMSMADYFGSQPIIIENEGIKKRLHLPTKEVLAAYDRETQLLFHPLSEYITIGESDVFKSLKAAVRLVLITRIANLVESLAILGTSTDLHGRMTPSQLMFLEHIAGIDDNSVNKLKDVLVKTLDTDPTKTLLSIFMTRDTVVGETKYPRVCNVSFPFMKVLTEAAETTESKRRVFDTDVRKKTPDDIKIWKGIFNYIFPDCSVAGTYSKGSDHYAPYFGSLLEVYYEIQSRINIVISEFSSFLTMNEYIKLVDLKWYGIFNSGTVVNDLPNLGGNKGGAIEREVVKPISDIDTPPWDTSIPNTTLNVPTPKPAGLGIEEIRRQREALARGDRPQHYPQQTNHGYQPPPQPNRGNYPQQPSRGLSIPSPGGNWRDLV